MRRRWATAAPAAFATPVVGGTVTVVSLPRRTPGTAAAALAAPTATDALAKSRRLTFLLIRSSWSTRRRSSILHADATDPQRNSGLFRRRSPHPDRPHSVPFLIGVRTPARHCLARHPEWRSPN